MMNIYNAEPKAAIAAASSSLTNSSSGALNFLSKQMKNEFPAYVYAWHMLNAPAHTLLPSKYHQGRQRQSVNKYYSYAALCNIVQMPEASIYT